MVDELNHHIENTFRAGDGNLGILIPQVGKNIPVKLKILKGKTDQGAPFYVWKRYFDFPDKPTFETIVICDKEKQFLLDLVGNEKQMYMAWDEEFHPEEQMLTLNNYGYGIKFRNGVFWLPKWFWKWTIGYEKFNQYADQNDNDVTHVDLKVIHPIFGKVFQYNGIFRVILKNKNNLKTKICNI